MPKSRPNFHDHFTTRSPLPDVCLERGQLLLEPAQPAGQIAGRLRGGRIRRFRRLQVVDHDGDEQIHDDEDGDNDEADVEDPRPGAGCEARLHHLDPALERHDLEQRHERPAERAPPRRVVRPEERHADDPVAVQQQAEEHQDVPHRRDRPQHRPHDQPQLRDARHEARDPQDAGQPRNGRERAQGRHQRGRHHREIERVPAVAEEGGRPGAVRQQPDADLDHERRLGERVEPPERRRVRRRQRARGLEAHHDRVEHDEAQDGVLEPHVSCDGSRPGSHPSEDATVTAYRKSRKYCDLISAISMFSMTRRRRPSRAVSCTAGVPAIRFEADAVGVPARQCPEPRAASRRPRRWGPCRRLPRLPRAPRWPSC